MIATTQLSGVGSPFSLLFVRPLLGDMDTSFLVLVNKRCRDRGFESLCFQAVAPVTIIYESGPQGLEEKASRNAYKVGAKIPVSRALALVGRQGIPGTYENPIPLNWWKAGRGHTPPGVATDYL